VVSKIRTVSIALSFVLCPWSVVLGSRVTKDNGLRTKKENPAIKIAGPPGKFI
jgi:hypothetical protein